MLTTPAQLGEAGRVARRSRRPFRLGLSVPVLAILSVSLGLALGIGSAWYAVGGEYPFGRVRAGAWTLWPRIGSRDIDPYARAIVSRRADLPLGVGEGVAMRATRDDAGRPLNPACTYRLGRLVPQARAWTLTAYDVLSPGSGVDDNGHLSSAELVRGGDGGFDITLSRDVMPGNWLRLPGGAILLILRLYDTPITSGAAALDTASVPRIERLGCAP